MDAGRSMQIVGRCNKNDWEVVDRCKRKAGNRMDGGMQGGNTLGCTRREQNGCTNARELTDWME